MKTIKIELNKKEIKRLKSVVKFGMSKAREITRARTLLLANERESTSTIARVLTINPSTVRNIKQYYLSGGVEIALYDSPRSGAPSKFNGKNKAAITALACTKAPAGHAKWSLNLLAEKAIEIEGIESISPAQVGRILKKMKLNLI